MKSTLGELIVVEFDRRVFEESYPRILQCLDLLSEEEIWKRPNNHLSSIGNLVLHLCGNGRQWIVSGLGNKPDLRERNTEFLPESKVPKEELVVQMELLKKDMKEIISGLTEEDLVRKRDVQIFHESGLSVLIHVIEHFSYHTGQITWYTKSLRQVDLRYYDLD